MSSEEIAVRKRMNAELKELFQRGQRERAQKAALSRIPPKAGKMFMEAVEDRYGADEARTILLRCGGGTPGNISSDMPVSGL